MRKPSAWDVIAACPVADEAEWLRHAEAFAAAFVVSAKKERWHELFARRPQRIVRSSHKLHADLDRRFCCPERELPSVIRGEGLFYGFYDSPRVMPADQARAAAGCGDAIFSLIPGELAVYFFHEGEIWLCQR